MTLGLRYTRDKKSVDTQIYNNGLPPALESSQSESFNNTSVNITLHYRATDDVSIYGRVGTGYRAGGFSPRGFNAPAYEPEEALVYEVGLKSELLDRRLRMNLTAYYTDYDDFQITQPGFSDDAGFVSNTINAGKATYQGFEAEITAVPMHGMTLMLGASYVDPEYKEFNYLGEDLKDSAKFGYVSEWSFHAGFQYEAGLTNFGRPIFNVDYSYKSERVFESLSSDPLGLPNARDDLDGEPRKELSARFALTDIAIGNAELVLAIFGENLLDEEYRVSTIDFGALGFGTAVYNRPRVIGAEAKIRF